MPHAPQLVAAPRLASQPSAALPLQSPKPASQVDTQAPVAHEALAFAAAAQVTPQPPQLAIVVVATSQPLAAMPSQSAVPVSQVRLQPPAASQPLATMPSQSPQPELQT